MFYIITTKGNKVKQGDLVWFATAIDTVSGDIDEYSLGILLEVCRRKEYASILYGGGIHKAWLRNIIPDDYR